MDLKDIKELIKFVSKSGVSEVELEQEGFKLVIKATQEGNAQPTAMMQAAGMPQQPAGQGMPQPQAPAAPQEGGAGQQEQKEDSSKYIEVKAPMIGTFYRAPGPDKDVFVKVGDSISPGQTVCIIEAMKLFNEIESEVSGKIVKVLVEDASPVEYDQPLFLVDPS